MYAMLVGIFGWTIYMDPESWLKTLCFIAFFSVIYFWIVRVACSISRHGNIATWIRFSLQYSPRLKRLFTILTALGLALVPPAAVGVVAPVEVSCPKPSDSCCETSGKPACPTQNDDAPVDCCLNCSLVCCAYLPVKSAALPLPADASFRWLLTAEKGKVRREPPPLPPPRGSWSVVS
jgi:hypothetical protein